MKCYLVIKKKKRRHFMGIVPLKWYPGRKNLETIFAFCWKRLFPRLKPCFSMATIPKILALYLARAPWDFHGTILHVLMLIFEHRKVSIVRAKVSGKGFNAFPAWNCVLLALVSEIECRQMYSTTENLFRRCIKNLWHCSAAWSSRTRLNGYIVIFILDLVLAPCLDVIVGCM